MSPLLRVHNVQLVEVQRASERVRKNAHGSLSRGSTRRHGIVAARASA